MIRIKLEVEEQETTLPIESQNVGFPSDNNKVTKKPPTPEKNVVVAAKVPKKVVPKKKKKLDNSTANSVAAFDLKSIKTEPPTESSLSLTTQLNHSLTVQSLVIQNIIQNGRTTNEQSIPIGTQQQQQQQSLISTKIKPIVPEFHQEVPLLDQCSLIPNGIQQQQQSVFLPKIKPIVSEFHQQIPLLDQCFSNSNSMESTTTTNWDSTTEMSSGPRAGLGRRAKSNVCYSVPKEPNPVPRRRENIPELLPPSSADNSESTYNDNEQNSVCGSISGPGPSESSSQSSVEVVVAAPSLLEQRELKRLKNVEYLRRYREKETEEQRQWRLEQGREYSRERRPQLLAMATPEQLERKRLKEVEKYRRKKEKETEEQRQQRLERGREYARKVAERRREKRMLIIAQIRNEFNE